MYVIAIFEESVYNAFFVFILNIGIYIMIKVEHIHFDATNGFSGVVGFLVDNRLFKIHFITPLFNDFKEFRITSAFISNQAYDPENNTVSLSPSKHIPDFYISQKELDFLDLYFNYDYVSKYKYQTYNKNNTVYSDSKLDQQKLNHYISQYGEKPFFPFDYLNADEFCIATLIDTTDKDNKIINDYLTLFVPIKRNKCDYFDCSKMNINNWTDCTDLTQRLGMFNLFVPVLKGILKEFQ